MTAFTIITYVAGIIISMCFLFGIIWLIDGFVNKLPSKVKYGTILLAVAFIVTTLGGVKMCKKIYKMRKIEIWNQWYQNDVAWKEYSLKKQMMCGHEGEGMDAACCDKKDSTMMKKCTPAMCEKHTK